MITTQTLKKVLHLPSNWEDNYHEEYYKYIDKANKVAKIISDIMNSDQVQLDGITTTVEIHLSSKNKDSEETSKLLTTFTDEGCE